MLGERKRINVNATHRFHSLRSAESGKKLRDRIETTVAVPPCIARAHTFTRMPYCSRRFDKNQEEKRNVHPKIHNDSTAA